MTTVAQVDRLVVSDDAVVARLWPRLGPRVRRTYLADRDRWIGLRRTLEGGATLSATTLAAQRKVFAGWARAFSAAGRTHPRPRPAPAPTTKVTAPLAAAPLPAAPLERPAAVIKKTGVGPGTAVAGGLVLAGLIAVAARRKRP